jgi:hypothetical protein
MQAQRTPIVNNTIPTPSPTPNPTPNGTPILAVRTPVLTPTPTPDLFNEIQTSPDAENILPAASSGALPVPSPVSTKTNTQSTSTIPLAITPSRDDSSSINPINMGMLAAALNSVTESGIAKVTTVLGVLAGALYSMISLFASPLSSSELYLIPMRLWGLFLAFFSIRKRSPPWGTVYDSVTKQPLDPAYVTVEDASGNVVKDMFTDIDGRYGLLLSSGIYTISANKTNYVFPSQRLSGQHNDELYENLYFGEKFSVTSQDDVVKKDIPLDPVDFDWNEYAKNERHLTSFYYRYDRYIKRLLDIVFIIGFTLSTITTIFTPSIYNIVVTAVYALIFFILLSVHPRPYGTITSDVTGQPLPFAIIKVFSTDRDTIIGQAVSDLRGRYYCLIPKGRCYVSVEQKNSDGSYTTVVDKTPMSGEKGIIRENMTV